MLKPQFNSIRSFLYGAVIIVALPGLLSVVLQAGKSTRLLFKQTEHEAIHLADSAAEGMGNHLQNMTTSIAVISRLPLGKDHLASFYRIVRGFADQAGYHVTLADADGNQFLSSRLSFGTPPPRRIAMDSVNKAVASGRPHVSEIFQGIMAGHYVITVDAPVRTEEGLRVITLTSDASAIAEVLFQTDVPKDWILGLIDGQGVFIAHSKTSEQWVGRKIPPEFIEAANQSEHSIIRNASIESFPTLTIFSRVPGTSWSIVISIPESVVNASLMWHLTVIAGYLGAVIGLTVLLVFLFSRQLTAATDKLIKVARDPIGSIDRLPVVNAFVEFEEVIHVLKTVAASQQQLLTAQRISELRFRQLFDDAPVPLCFFNKDGVLSDFNNLFEQTFGYNSDDVPTLSEWQQRAYPDPYYRQWAIETWNAAVRHARENHVVIEPAEYLVTCKDSKVLTVLISGTILDDGFISTFSDITDRRRAETALEESELRFRTMVNAMPQLAWIARGDGHVFWYNQRWYDYTGTVPEQMEGWGWQSVHDPIKLPMVLEQWQASLETHEPFDMTFPLRGADGVFRPFLTRVIPLKDTTGRVQQWFGTNTDVSELKYIEQKLRESERLYRSIGESIDYGVWVCSPDGRNTYASESFLRMVGITQEQCSNFGWGNVLHPDDAERTIAKWQECVRTGSKWDIEHRFHGTDGKWHHVLARGVPVRNEHGEIVSWAGINLDISRIKQAEEQIRASLAEKEILLKEIHHRVKNNLQVISSLIGLQTDSIDDEHVQGVFRDLCDRIRSISMVHEKLYKSDNIAQLNFAEYAASLLQYLWRVHGPAGNTLRLNLSLASLILPIDSAVPFGLILNELATNAIKHAFPDGREGEVSVILEHDSATGAVCLRVCDTGIGLPTNFDCRQSTTLGLRLVQILAEQMHAEVQTGSGPGTEFQIRFFAKQN